ncbi:MAG TPA: hypothetical protein VLB46_16405 [Pyrinomonadaceae bacterium]|nr:hypothetical protein [Pyrinomonadaceae bacterium]
MKNKEAIDQESNGVDRRSFIAKTIFAGVGSLALAALQNEASAIEVKGQRLPDAVLAFSGVEAKMKG